MQTLEFGVNRKKGHMKVKKIRIKSREEFFSELEAVATKLDRGKRARRLKGEFFESLDSIRNVLTPKRLELWHIIRDKEPHSILELSRIAKREFKSTHRDVTILVAAGIVELREGKGSRGTTQQPISLADTLLLEVA